MQKPIILCIDDQREVLSAIVKDLMVLDGADIYECESANEAFDLLTEFEIQGKKVAIILCDHIMPEIKGVDFLKIVKEKDLAPGSYFILLTGLASHQDTIDAINLAAISQYIAKPYKIDNLLKVIKIYLTKWLVNQGEDINNYQGLIDSETLYKDYNKFSDL